MPAETLLKHTMHSGDSIQSYVDARYPQPADATGLDKAYASPHGYYYDRENRSFYIAGTRDFMDVATDVTLLPAQKMKYSQRERDSNVFVQQNLQEIDRIVGHSMGGSVALDLSNKYQIPGVTYGAPVFDQHGNQLFNPGSRTKNQTLVRRYAHPGDPIAAFDTKAHQVGGLRLNPHDYRGYA